MRPRPLRWIAAILLLALVGAGLWAWLSARSSTEASEEDALATFRARGGVVGARTPGVPRPGVYTYRQTGSERGGVGPATLSRSVPSRARYLVTLVPGGYQEELRISEEHIEGVRYRVGPQGSRTLWRRTEVRLLGIGRDDRRDVQPPPLRMPLRPVVGRRWQARYRVGDLTVDVVNRVIAARRVRVDGRPVPVVVVRSQSITRGSFPGGRTETLWWSAAHALALRWRIEMDVEGAVDFTSSIDLRLESLHPRV